MSNTIIMSNTKLCNGRLTNLNDVPLEDRDAVNQNYVDGQSQKSSVKAATIGNISLTGIATIDDTTINENDRVLVKDQTDKTENGIYYLNASGNLVRANGAEPTDVAAGSSVFVTDGTINDNTFWYCIDTYGTLFGANTTYENVTSGPVSFIELVEPVGTNTITLQAPTLASDIVLILPDTDGFSGQVLSTDGAGTTTWSTQIGAAGDVTGPNASTNNAISVFDGTTGKLIKNTGIIIDASNNLTNANSIVAAGTVSAGTLTDGTGSLSSGNLTSIGSISADSLTTSGTIQGLLITDGTGTLTGGNLTSIGSIGTVSLTASGTVQGATLTTGTADITGSVVSGLTSLTSTTVSGTTISDGTATLTAGILSGLVTPTQPTHATNKAYVDAIAQGLTYADAVDCASTGTNITLSGTQTIDGVFAGTGSRVLLKDQTLPRQNGIWIAATTAWARSTDLATGSQASGVSVLVSAGTINLGSGFVCNSLSTADTVGDDAGTTGDDLTFVQYTAGVTITAGSGLTKTGNDLSVNVDNITLRIFSDTLELKDASISPVKLQTNSITTVKVLDSNITNAKLANSSVTITAGDGLQTGGTVALGSSVTLNVDSTVIRSSGTQSLSGVTNFTNITNSSNSTSGAVVISGGVGIAKSVFLDENMTALGTVSATTLSDGTSSLTGGILSNLLTPVNNNDAANKAYVDALVSGLNFRDPVKAASVNNLTLSGLQTVDAVSLLADDRILVKDQTLPIQNGIYLVKAAAWVYAPDYPTSTSAQGLALLVEFGSVNIGTSFVVKGDDPYTIGTSDIIWVKFASGGGVNAGNGLGKTGSTLFINADNTTIEIVTDAIQVKNNSIDSTKLTNLAVTTAKLVDLSVTTEKLNTSSVTTAKILDSNVTNAKLQNSSITINSGDGLQNGAIVSLGSTITLDVDATVLRTTGNQSADGIQLFTNTTDSLDTDSGCIVLSGGMGVAKTIVSGGNLIVSGIASAGTLTDGTVNITNGNITGISSFSAGTVNATTFTDGTATMTAGALTGLVNPAVDTQAATKGYVDALAQGVKWKSPVKYTTIGLNDNYVLSAEQTIDGVAAVDGDRVLLKDQNFPRQNGIWIVRTGAWERSSDMLENSDAAGASVLIEDGNLNAGAGFVCSNSTGSATVGNNAGTTGDDLFFVQFTGAGSLLLGDALFKDGNTINVHFDDITIGLTTNELYVKDNSITASKLTLNSVSTAKIINANVTNAKLQYSSLSVNPGDGLKNGGSVALGGSTSIAVNSTVLRTSGDQSASGVQSFTNVSQSTNISTGALVVSGGMGVSKNINTSGNITATGTFTGSGITDGTATLTGGNLTGLNAVSGGSLAVTGNVSGSIITDGTATLTAGSFTDITNISANGTISANSITDGTATLNGGSLIGLIAPTIDSHATNKAYVDAISVNAGLGLVKIGSDINVNPDNLTLEIVADVLKVKDSGIITSKLATNSVTTAKLVDNNITNIKLVNSSITVTAGDGLQTGGIVSLGSAVTLNVDSTIIRTTGNQTAAGVKTFSDTTQTINTTTGGVVIAGGLGIAKNAFIGGNLTSTGTTTVGTLTDGTATLNSGNISSVNTLGAVNINASGTVTSGTLTDGTLSINSGSITGAVNIASSGIVTAVSFTDGTATLSGGTLTNLISPTADSDAATKSYVDAVSVGISWKDPVRVAAIGNKTLSGTQAIDGETLVLNDRVLIKDQTNAVQNGVYDYNPAGAWPRSSDFSSGSAENFAVLVSEGSTNIGSGWVVNGVSPYTINSSLLTFAQFSAGGAVNAGSGLDKTGSTLNVSTDNTSIAIVTNSLQVKDSGITPIKIATNAVTTVKILDANVTNAKLQNSSVTVTAGDGMQTGGNVALGGTITLNVDPTVLRTSGDQTINGIQTFANNTQSTSSITGSLILAGGLGIAKDLNSIGNISTTGTLTSTIVTDGTLTITGGNVSSVGTLGTVTINTSGTITGLTLTDSIASLNAGSLTGLINSTASGTVTAGSFTDSTATLTSGTLAGLVAPTVSTHATNKAYVDGLVVTAGSGLTKTSTSLNVNVDNVTIELLTNQLRLMDNSITATKLKTDSITTIKILDANVTNAKLLNSSITLTAGDGLQTGGTVSLGGTVVVNVDSSILRTSGAQSASGIQSFTNTTNSTSGISGAVVITGGLGIGGDTYTTGRIQTNGVIQGTTLTDGTASLNSGTLTTTGNVNTGNVVATNTVQGVTLTDSIASLNAGAFTGLTSVTASGPLTLSSIPTNRVLYTTTGGQITSNAGATFDGTTLATTILDAQNITRPIGTNQASLWTTGTGNIDIGLQTVGTIQMGQGPMFKLTSSTSILKSSLTIQGNLSRRYVDTTISTAGNVTYTAQQIANGIIFRDCNGASRVDILPTAEDLVNIIPEPVVGSSVEVFIRNESTDLSLLTLASNTGITLYENLTIASGITSRFLIKLDNIIFGQYAATVFASVPKDRTMIQSTFTNPTSGGSAVKYAQWGPESGADVDSTVIGYSGKIVQLVCSYSAGTPVGVDVGESLNFSVGTSNDTLTTFTPFTGGTNVVSWTNTVDGTYPSTSSGSLSIPFTAANRIAIRSIETGTVSPLGMYIRCTLTVQLD